MNDPQVEFVGIFVCPALLVWLIGGHKKLSNVLGEESYEFGYDVQCKNRKIVQIP